MRVLILSLILLFGTTSAQEPIRGFAVADLTVREVATFAPLLILAFWIGLYPAPFLRRLETSVDHVMMRVNDEYIPRTALMTCPDGSSEPAVASRMASAEGRSASPFLMAACEEASQPGRPLASASRSDLANGHSPVSGESE